MTLVETLAVYWVNGLLALVYFTVGRLPEILSAVAAGVLGWVLLPEIEARAVARPMRYGRGEVMAARPAARTVMGIALATWMVASLVTGFPVNVIGAFMWVAANVAVLMVSEERVNVQWWAVMGILVYAVLVLLYRGGLWMLQRVDAMTWASTVGSASEAQVMLDTTRRNAAMMGMLFIFLFYPLGYLALLFNRVVRNPKPLYNVFAEAGDVLRRLRTRNP